MLRGTCREDGVVLVVSLGLANGGEDFVSKEGIVPRENPLMFLRPDSPTGDGSSRGFCKDGNNVHTTLITVVSIHRLYCM